MRRPMLCASTKITAPMRAALDEVAALSGESPSALLRDALVAELERRGAWPPKVAK